MDNSRHIAASTVKDICGGVSDMTLWRWLNDPTQEFPRPTYIRKRRYWREAAIREWWEVRSREQIAA
jgi:predicted DNA-binding transcriptional regulator AlpA